MWFTFLKKKKVFAPIIFINKSEFKENFKTFSRVFIFNDWYFGIAEFVNNSARTDCPTSTNMTNNNNNRPSPEYYGQEQEEQEEE